MDASRFDALARALSAVDSRRKLLASLVTAPLLGVLLPTPDDTDARPRRHRAQRRHDTHQGLAAEKKKRKKKHKKPKPTPTCQPDSTAQTCAGKCGSVTNTCGQAVNCGSCTCTPGCEPCYTCQERGPNERGVCVIDPDREGKPCGSGGQVCQQDGSCACEPACTGKTCGPDGCGGSCGACDAGQACTTEGVCCTPTTCARIDQEMCQTPDDCGDYGICGTFPDGCGGEIDCGGCSHPCIGCQNNICVFTPGGQPCGPDTCCFNQCCASPGQGICGIQARCADGDCCPLGFTCCNGSVNGSPRSSCYNIDTYCGGDGLYCCQTGNTCCLDEPCCTSDAQCSGGRRCMANGAPSTAGCCSLSH